MPELSIGARGSRLSVAQTEQTIKTLSECFKELKCTLKTYATGGDTDKTTSLTDASVPDNFFTDTLDQAVLSGEIDAAFHSAKDLPDEIDDRLDWFFLPWREDPRDAILYQKTEKELPKQPVVGVSSPSREAFAKKRWPGCVLKPIRGNIDDRIEQLKRGEFDVILLAIAGLNRLGLAKHISEKVSLKELPSHEAQGTLALTWKKGNKVLEQLRMMLSHPVSICGAGTGREGNYTVATAEALQASTICFHDSLMDHEILSHCKGEIVHVGKRYHDEQPSQKQKMISKAMVNAIRKGQHVVRLKGGDPSFFARLSDEIAVLIEYGIRFKVYPGVPWLCSAPVNHGIFLTERGRIRHFSVATGTDVEGKILDGSKLKSAEGPVYFFMATRQLKELSESLMKAGYAKDTPAAVMREERGRENIVRATLANISKAYADSELKPPALFVIGDAASIENKFSTPKGPLHGLRVLVPGSTKTRKKLAEKMIQLDAKVSEVEPFALQPNFAEAKSWVKQIETMDWLVFASGSAVELFLEVLKEYQFDLRKLPKLAVTGPSATKSFSKHGLYVDTQSETFTSESFAECFCKDHDIKGKKILIPRSSASQSKMPEMLKQAGAEVELVNLYTNKQHQNLEIPKVDVALFCSPSSVESILKEQRELIESCKLVASIGPVTTKALQQHDIKVDIEPSIFDAEHLAMAIASHVLWSA